MRYPLREPAPQPGAPPEPCRGLEEAGAADPRDWPQAAAFALVRAGMWTATRDGTEPDARPVAFVATAAWRRERGGLSVRGFMGLGFALSRVMLVRVERDIEALWALEEALKSGAVAGAVATVEHPSLVATRRLDFAARAGRATAVLLRTGPSVDLSAARLRWRIEALASALHRFDPRAPGAMRMRAALERRRNGPLGVWDLEQDHETHRLRLAAGLADHGLVPGRRAHAA